LRLRKLVVANGPYALIRFSSAGSSGAALAEWIS
jgi:hypothetical protein